MPKKSTQRQSSKRASASSNKQRETTENKRAIKKEAEILAKSEITQPRVSTEYDNSIPGHILFGIFCFLFFIILLISAVNRQGIILELLHRTVTGLIGYVGFYAMIPALFYMSFINLWGRIRKKTSRSVCTIAFVFCIGCIYHLALQTSGSASALEQMPSLYVTGASGRSGGILCGGVINLLQWACGDVVSTIALGIATVLTLLGAMEMSIPSLIRAIRNRPRDDWEDEEQEDVYIEPAERVVNKIATRQIENRHKKRQASLQGLPTSAKAENAVFIPQESASVSRATSAKKKKSFPAPEEEISDTADIPEFVPASSGKRPASRSEKTTPTAENEELPPLFAQSATNDSTLQDAVPEATRTAGKKKNILQTLHAFDDDAVSAVRVEIDDEEQEDILSTIIRTSYNGTVPTDTPDESEQDTLPEDEIQPSISDCALDTPPKPQTRVSVPVTVRTADKRARVPQSVQPEVTHKDTAAAAASIAAEISTAISHSSVGYQYPPIDLLNLPASNRQDGTDEIQENTDRLNKTLESFHIDARICDVIRGPSVTRYEVKLSEGVRLNKLVNCADDIALSLGASGVRIAAIAGKISIVGIEVPNRSVTMVSLREVIDSDAFRRSKSNSSFSVGKSISGQCIVGNIAKMPHMLIAGTTGSGKSVCMNSIIISLLYKSSPEDIKLIMVDPKMVELGIYNNIPHLLIPVVTDPKKAAGSLQWAVTEMLRRYKLMSEIGVRDLASYNEEVLENDSGQKLPSIVIIIDELADLMLVAAKEVEDSICRIAQMGRAAGMHLIIATQRPSADVITGLMKANIPSRIAFSVASAMESRIILDTQGAEKLVGKGDMLYAPIGEGKPLRVQGCFVTDAEVERVAKYVKQNSQAEYDANVQQEVERNAQQTGKGSKPPASTSDTYANDEETEGDEMLPAAVDVILETNQASVSMLQRRLKLGYARAARIVDEMEEKGLVGPFQGSKPRAILVTKEQWAAMRSGDTTGMDNGN